MADREGRLLDRPRRIKIEVLPGDNYDVDAGLQSLHDAGMIERYEIDKNKYIQVVNFAKHQNPHVKENASTIPAPCQHHTNTVQAPCKHDTSTSLARLIPDSGFLDSLIPDTGSRIPELKYDDDGARVRDPFDPSPRTPEEAAAQRVINEFIPCGIASPNSYTMNDVTDMLIKSEYGANIEARADMIIRAMKSVGEAPKEKRSWGNVKGLIAYWQKNGEKQPGKSNAMPDYTPPTGNPFRRAP